jgi:hypothetical protein
MKRWVVGWMLGALVGCSSGGGGPEGAGGSAASPSEISSGTAGGSGAAGAAGALNGSDASGVVNPVPLPAGSREFDGIVNLVDAAAAKEVDDFLVTNHGPRSIFDEHDLTTSLNLFLERYVELYDFVYFLTDHPLPQTTFIGKFQVVTRIAQVGTGNQFQIDADGYKTNGRVKGVIAVQYLKGQYGPFAHEMLHYWANYLDPIFGFGVSTNGSPDPHWGFAGLHGQLGGFDPSTLVCETPSAALPPSCMPLPNGRFHYAADWFAPNANGDVLYAPFELYLMGLLSRSELPPAITVLTDAKRLDNAVNPVTRKVVVDASGMRDVHVDDIVARHGEVKALAKDERAFRAAFVVISATPVLDSVLADVASWAAIFGKRKTDPVIKSFEELTGGRATLDTELGPRRDASQPPPEVRPQYNCNVLAQDCVPAGTGCYLNSPRSICATPLGILRNMPCKDSTDCAAGLECVTGKNGSSCEPFCDPVDRASPISCDKVCLNYIVLTTPEGKIEAGRCLPP